MSTKVDYELGLIAQALYRIRRQMSTSTSVKGTNSGTRFELKVPISGHIAIVVNESRWYLFPSEQKNFFSEDDSEQYVEDMPFQEKAAFVEIWNVMKARLHRDIEKNQNLKISVEKKK